MTGAHITPADLDKLVEDALTSPRMRQHRNLHQSPSEPCQRLISAVGVGSYIRPHRHPDSCTNECLIALRGAFALITFDDVGDVREILEFGWVARDVAIVEVEPMTWHTVIALVPGSVLFETKSGPFVLDRAKSFACWAPEEGSPEAASYFAGLLSVLGGGLMKQRTPQCKIGSRVQ